MTEPTVILAIHDYVAHPVSYVIKFSGHSKYGVGCPVVKLPAVVYKSFYIMRDSFAVCL